jgi:hypothetical protein
MSGLTGDFKGLDDIVKQLEGYADKVPAIAKDASPRVQSVIEANVAAGKDPYGNAFAPLKQGGTPLGTLENPVKVTPRGTSIFARVTRKLPRYLNRGRAGGEKKRGGFMPPRPIVPEGDGAPIPPAWVAELEDAADRAMGEKGRR